MNFEIGDRVITSGQTVPPQLRRRAGTVKAVDEDRARPVVVEMDDSIPFRNHNILSFFPQELIIQEK